MFNKKNLIVLVLYTLILLLENSRPVQSRNPQEYLEKRKLIEKLLSSYDKTRKPAGQVNIKFALNLNQINRVKAKDQIFELNTFVDHEWIDPRLRWDPAQNHNISVLRIACENLWTWVFSFFFFILMILNGLGLITYVSFKAWYVHIHNCWFLWIHFATEGCLFCCWKFRKNILAKSSPTNAS